MTDLEIVAVDPFDAASFDPWWQAYHDAEQADPDVAATIWQLEELRAQLQDPGRRQWVAGWSGVVGGEVVTTGCVVTPLLDNLDRANLAVTTIKGHRRRGYAAAMLAHLERVAGEKGRTILGGETYWPYAAGPDGAGAPGREFARRHGYELALGDVQRRLPLPVDGAVLDELAAEAASRHSAYTLRSWVGPVPEELVVEMAEMDAALMTEAPMGELDIEPQAADVPALREGEELLRKQGRTKYSTVALDADGHAAAYTDLVTTIHEPDRAYQWGTLVRRAHRGHRLGLAVKIANLQMLLRERPDLAQVITFNAEVNEHMIGVNERLGFTPVSRLGELQKKLA